MDLYDRKFTHGISFFQFQYPRLYPFSQVVDGGWNRAERIGLQPFVNKHFIIGIVVTENVVSEQNQHLSFSIFPADPLRCF